MAIALTCNCGKSYELKDEMAGRLMQCPNCGMKLRAPLPPVTPGDPTFARNKFLLRQKALSINEKYQVWDEQGNALLFVERPAMFLRNLASKLIMAFGMILATAVALFAFFGIAEATDMLPLAAIAAVIGFAVVGAGAFMLGLLVEAKRHVYFYRDAEKQQKVMEILQDQKFAPIIATFTVKDASGQTIAHLRKNFLYNLFRKQWECMDGQRQLICMAKEDSIILSLLRRLLGPMLGLLRANFIFTTPDGQTVIGEFNRKFTLLDRYVLDMSADSARLLDRRLALAIGVLLDTAEKR